MGHIVLAPQNLVRFHLHERLLRGLRQRGHRASVLATAPAIRTFWRHHDLDALATLPPAPPPDVDLGDLLATTDSAPSPGLRAIAASLVSWFAAERPDLLVLHQARTPMARLVQFVARRAGCRVLWTGDGLLPHTLQCDDRGLDGEASCGQRPAVDFRVVRGEPELLHACLANVLARAEPFALPRAPVQAPPLRERLSDALTTWRELGGRAALASLSAWQQALPPAAPAPTACRLPTTPFVAVLLQADDDPRLRLDAAAPPSASRLLRATAAALRELAIDADLVAVAAGPTSRRHLAGVPLAPAAAAPDLAATALATVTINHPLASVALLAGTPVLHIGRALYGVRGVATRTTLATLAADLRQALAHDYPTLRQRFLSWVFGHGHVWCSPDSPDHNGMLGLLHAIEARLAEPVAGSPLLRYRTGPGWPLAADPRR